MKRYGSVLDSSPLATLLFLCQTFDCCKSAHKTMGSQTPTLRVMPHMIMLMPMVIKSHEDLIRVPLAIFSHVINSPNIDYNIGHSPELSFTYLVTKQLPAEPRISWRRWQSCWNGLYRVWDVSLVQWNIHPLQMETTLRQIPSSPSAITLKNTSAIWIML